jgi:hypothetical protein
MCVDDWAAFDATYVEKPICGGNVSPTMKSWLELWKTQ